MNKVLIKNPPTINLTDSRYIIMFRHIYPESSPFHGQLDKFISVNYFQ